MTASPSVRATVNGTAWKRYQPLAPWGDSTANSSWIPSPVSTTRRSRGKSALVQDGGRISWNRPRIVRVPSAGSGFTGRRMPGARIRGAEEEIGDCPVPPPLALEREVGVQISFGGGEVLGFARGDLLLEIPRRGEVAEHREVPPAGAFENQREVAQLEDPAVGEPEIFSLGGAILASQPFELLRVALPRGQEAGDLPEDGRRVVEDAGGETFERGDLRQRPVEEDDLPVHSFHQDSLIEEAEGGDGPGGGARRGGLLRFERRFHATT